MPIQRRLTPVPSASDEPKVIRGEVVDNYQATSDDDDLYAKDDVDNVVLPVNSGWNAAKKLQEETKSANITNELKLGEDERLIAFLPGQIPLDSYKQHWINRQKGKRSFVCLGADCPLCEKAGDVPSAKFAFGVLAFDVPEDPEADIEVNPALLVAGTRLMDMLYAIDQDPKRGPLASRFFSISRSGTSNTTSYSVRPIKTRDLSEDWGIDAADAEEELDKYTTKDVRPVYRSDAGELLAVAREILGR